MDLQTWMVFKRGCVPDSFILRGRNVYSLWEETAHWWCHNYWIISPGISMSRTGGGGGLVDTFSSSKLSSTGALSSTFWITSQKTNDWKDFILFFNLEVSKCPSMLTFHRDLQPECPRIPFAAEDLGKRSRGMNSVCHLLYVNGQHHLECPPSFLCSYRL